MRHVMTGLVAASLLLASAGCVIVSPDPSVKPASITPAPKSTPVAEVAKKVSVFSGTWDTNDGMMTLTDNGSQVTGTYGKYGKVQGVISDDGLVLQATWSDDTSSGTVNFRVSDDGNEITGIWTQVGVDGKRKDWTGTRVKAATLVK